MSETITISESISNLLSQIQTKILDVQNRYITKKAILKDAIALYYSNNDFKQKVDLCTQTNKDNVMKHNEKRIVYIIDKETKKKLYAIKVYGKITMAKFVECVLTEYEKTIN